jgi:nucleotide-binding universal stress UspA family protein
MPRGRPACSLREAPMTIRDILVLLDSSPAGEARMRLALALADRRKARVTAAYVLPLPRAAAPLIGLGPLPPSTPAWTLAPAAGPPRDPERAEEIERAFRKALGDDGIEGEWYLLDAGNLAELVECANSVDLTILGRQSEAAEADRAGAFAPDDIIVEVGRPVLVVPSAGTFATVGRRPLIAWDGSREAARALGDALPLIEEAEAATVIHIGAGERELERAQPSLDRIVAHLQRHAIKASGERALGGDAAIPDLLLARAAALDADLIVAGAYHHSPLREALLGGISRELLRRMRVPLLMAH